MNAKVYLSKENNDVVCGLTSDAVCILVKPISGQQSGRNVTTDKFFTSVELSNRLKNKNLTLVRTMTPNKKEISMEFKPAWRCPEYSSLFGFTKDLTLASYVPKKIRSVVLLSLLHPDAVVCDDTEKPEIIEYYYKTKDAVDTLDQMCARYTVLQVTRRWIMAMLYGMVNLLQ